MKPNTTDEKFPIEKAVELITAFDDKINKILSSQEIEIESISHLKKDTENVIKLLFDSVLEGEFVRNAKVKEHINIIKSNTIFSSEEFENKIEQIKNGDPIVVSYLLEIGKLIFLIENILHKYLHFIDDVKYLISDDKDYIFSISQNSREGINREEFGLFLVNIELCVCDIQLRESLDYASNIEYLKSFIDGEGYLYKQKEKMLKKADFLLFKWQKRNDAASHIKDGEEIENTYENTVIKYDGAWKDTVEYINNHYSNDDRRSSLKKSFKVIKDKNFENYSCRDIHLYIKYYKDIEKNIVKLDSIVNFLKSKNKEEIFSVIHQYAVNNRFSLFLEKESDKNKIYEEYLKIKGEDRNYFPQFKFIKKFISSANEVLHREDVSLEEIKDIELFIKNNIEPEYEKYKTNMEWSSNHNNFIYRVCYEECMIEDIFIYSSFVLPAPNKEALKDYEIVSSNYQVLKTQIEPLKKISNLLFETKKRDVKTIELMGLFSAIIAFVMGSIPGFQFIKETYSAILFLLVFSTGLISFLLVLLLITKHNENDFNKKWWMILLFYLFMGGAMCYINSKLENQVKNEKEFSQQNTDDNLTKTKKDLKILNHMEMEKDSVPKENGISIPKN